MRQNGDVAAPNGAGNGLALGHDRPGAGIGQHATNAAREGRHTRLLVAAGYLPDGERNGLPRGVGALSVAAFGLRAGDSLGFESGNEDIVEQLQKPGPGAIGLRQGFARATRLRGDAASHGRHEVGIGAAKPVDRLLGIPDPEVPARDPRDAQKQGELDRACVLELVDQCQIEALGKNACYFGTLEQAQRLGFLIGKVDQPTRQLVVPVSHKGLRRTVEDAPDHGFKVVAQPRMTRVRRRRGPDAVDKRIGRHRRLDLRHLGPLLPRQGATRGECRPDLLQSL